MRAETTTAIWRGVSLLILLIVMLMCQNGLRHRMVAAPVWPGRLPSIAADDATPGERLRSSLTCLATLEFVMMIAHPGESLESGVLKRTFAFRATPLLYLRRILSTQAHSTAI